MPVADSCRAGSAVLSVECAAVTQFENELYDTIAAPVVAVAVGVVVAGEGLPIEKRGAKVLVTARAVGTTVTVGVPDKLMTSGPTLICAVKVSFKSNVKPASVKVVNGAVELSQVTCSVAGLQT